MNQVRIEKDSLGEVKVPADKLYGAQTQRAIDNFKISDLKLPSEFIKTIVQIKKAAAIVNAQQQNLPDNFLKAIIFACDQVIQGKYLDHFPIDVFQTGSGTSTNMNVNEVLTKIANDKFDMGINPNDHLNMSQSSNDVIPTAIHVSSCVQTSNKLIPAIEHLQQTITNKIAEVGKVVKTGRTHLMDAMPLTFEQELSGWWAQLEKNKQRLQSSLQRLKKLAQGGTAIGTGINASNNFGNMFASQISQQLGFEFEKNDNFFESISSQDAIVEHSGQIKTLAVSLIKIANDLRLMNSGPLSAIADIELPALQPGSSIMPGKVNPVIPEAVIMVGAQIIGNDTTISYCGSFGNFQLNVMLPAIAYNILQSINIAANSCISLADKAIKGFKVNESNIKKSLSANPILVTALNAVIGYQKAAAIAKSAYEQKRPIIDVAAEMTSLSKTELVDILDPSKLTLGGISK